MNKVASGVVWKILQQYSSYFVKLIVQIILARILVPEEFGIIAEVLVFITIAETIANSGLGTALIQKKDADELDYATVLSGSMVFASALYIILFFTAPLIGNFYSEPELPKLLRVYGIAIFFTAFCSVQNSYIMKRYELKKNFISSFFGAVISGVIAISLAIKGWGVWALVVQSLLATIISMIILQIMIKWRPTFAFDLSRFKSLFTFSWKVLVSSLFGMLLENLYNFSIGKYYNSETLGYYNRGNSFPNVIVGQLRTAVSAITLPLYSETQDKRDKLLASVKIATRLSVLVMFPMAIGLAAVSDPLIRVLLTDKWVPSIFFLRLECIFYGILPISASIGNAITSIGRSDISMKFESIKLASTIACILGLHTYGIKVLCVARVVVAITIIFYSLVISNKLIGYGLKTLIDDIWKPLTVSVVMGVLVYSVSYAELSNLATLLLQVVVGFVTYTAGVFLLMREDINLVRWLFLSKNKAEEIL